MATEPYSCIGIWLALEDASRTNGCLWALPGEAQTPGARQLLPGTWDAAHLCMHACGRMGAVHCLSIALNHFHPTPCSPPIQAGSHTDGVHRHFLRAADGSVSFTGSAEDMPAFDETRFRPVEVKAGSLVLLHGANVHLRWAVRVVVGGGQSTCRMLLGQLVS